MSQPKLKTELQADRGDGGDGRPPTLVGYPDQFPEAEFPELKLERGDHKVKATAINEHTREHLTGLSIVQGYAWRKQNPEASESWNVGDTIRHTIRVGLDVLSSNTDNSTIDYGHLEPGSSTKQSTKGGGLVFGIPFDLEKELESLYIDDFVEYHGNPDNSGDRKPWKQEHTTRRVLLVGLEAQRNSDNLEAQVREVRASDAAKSVVSGLERLLAQEA